MMFMLSLFLAYAYITTCSSSAGKQQLPVSASMFEEISHKIFRSDDSNPVQLNYGIAVTDVDNDGELEIVVAGFNGPNLVLKYDYTQKRLFNIAIDDPTSPYYALRNPEGQAIGVCVCDIDGDGREEIYFLNTNQAYSGLATYSDKLFKYRNGAYEDLLSDDVNKNIASYFAGRSVACIDRKGTGRYAVYLANYARGNVGPHALIEMDEDRSDIERGVIALKNVGPEAGVAKLTGGRGVTVGPILGETGWSDVFCDNEHGPNFLFKNNGDGTFSDVAAQTGVADPMEHGRGVALADFNGDGLIDIVYGNWNGPHRLFLQERKEDGAPFFKNYATRDFSEASPIRTVIAADFLNDANLEVLFNNIAYRGPAPNRVFSVVREAGSEIRIAEKNIGDAKEPNGRGTGGTVVDFDGDGFLELILAHGESQEQPLSVFRIPSNSTERSNKWLRVRPLTRQGAPARGAKVTMFTRTRGSHTRVIDAGSGYLCQMEPVAHFGLGTDSPTRVEVTWPDGNFRQIDAPNANEVLVVNHPGGEDAPHSGRREMISPQCGEGWYFSTLLNRCQDVNECEDLGSGSQCADNFECKNTRGSYKCVPDLKCPEGFVARENFTCRDVDECASSVCDQMCVNTPGSFRCYCRRGYRMNYEAGRCVDVDECQERRHRCEQFCHNHLGGYHCHCYRGYVLNRDYLTCRRVSTY